MTKGLFVVTMVYVAGVFDSVIAPSLTIYGVSPDFLALAATVATFLLRGPGRFVVAGVAGVIAEVNAPGRMGVGMAVYAIIAFSLCLLLRRTRRPPLVNAAITLVAVAAMSLGVAIVRSLLKELDWSPAGFAMASVAVGFYTALISVPCYYVVEVFVRRHADAF
jgi:rod shape-determining protein MreD